MTSYAPSLKVKAAAALEYRRRVQGVPSLPPLLTHQTPPDGAWRGWLFLAGRGAGKTYAGARRTLAAAERCGRLRIIAPTYADARDVCAEGESGIVPMARTLGILDTYNRSLGEIRLSQGQHIKLFSADEPDRLRGPQSGHDWYDELAAWRYAEATLDMALMGLRLGDNPQYVVTTTPRPTPVVRRLIADPTVVTTRATTFDNSALPEAFRTIILGRYEGTRLGRQELYAEMLDDTPGALWQRAQIDASRVASLPVLRRVVVGVDPPASSDGAECGIVVAGIDDRGNGYVIADCSTQGTPAAWAGAVLKAYAQYGADRIIAERNNGGEMVEHTLRSSGGHDAPISTVWASRGKATRAEPISALYEQGRIHHVGGLPVLEDQLCSWVPGDTSPDRLDALVWALTELFPNAGAAQPVVPTARVANRWSTLR
jgi:phage terminase large subunit-like protein